MTRTWVLYAFVLWLVVHADNGVENDGEDNKFYTNSWAVQLDAHDESLADEVAVNLGFENRGPIASLPGYFKFVHRQTEYRQKRSAEHHTQPLLAHPRVRWAKQQTQLFRFKRGYEAFERRKSERFTRVKNNIQYFDDPEWPKQWYLYDSGFSEASGNLGVLEAAERGYTGNGVVVSIIDDGLDHRNPDLRANYDPKASIDVNDNDFDPLPDYSTPAKIIENAHGTKCAGEVAAAANNGVCGVGVANQASIGGIRMLDGTITDAVEADALGFNCDYIDIKSASWGPSDDGKTFGRPEELGTKVMKNCALQGRQGRGTIYVWATGNGGHLFDNCNCDGYTSSIYTLSVGSISPGGFCTFYDEKCPSTMAVVYTGDVGVGKREKYANLVTTSLWLENHDGCVDSFSGTSCAAPLAAGIVALVLEARPELTWRDMQHLVVETARKNDPQSETWSRNAAGHNYSLCYGFGVLNAMDMINKAKDWELVGEQLTHEVQGQLTPETRKIPSNGVLTLKLRNEDTIINKLEHVQFMLSVDHRRRGDLVIELTSPQGTTSQLLAKRLQDDSTDGLDKWPFTSLEFWGEDPKGEWTIKIKDDKSENSFSPRGKNKDILFDEEESTQRDELILNDLTHGRFKEDYMKLAKRSKEESFQQSDEPNFLRELRHGRFKEDYMKLRADSSNPSKVESDESACSPSQDLKGPVAGCVTEWSLITYGTS